MLLFRECQNTNRQRLQINPGNPKQKKTWGVFNNIIEAIRVLSGTQW